MGSGSGLGQGADPTRRSADSSGGGMYSISSSRAPVKVSAHTEEDGLALRIEGAADLETALRVASSLE